jgi:hypothetical protein
MRQRYEPWWEKYEVRSSLAIDLFNSHQRDLWFRDDEEVKRFADRENARIEDIIASQPEEEDLPF